YCVGASPYLKNCGTDGGCDYLIYALDAGINAEDLGHDGGGTIAGIYCASDSQADGWPSSCSTSVYLINCTNNVANSIALMTDANTLLINSIVSGLRGDNGFKIQLGNGADNCQFINNATLESFVSSAGNFSHNYV